MAAVPQYCWGTMRHVPGLSVGDGDGSAVAVAATLGALEDCDGALDGANEGDAVTEPVHPAIATSASKARSCRIVSPGGDAKGQIGEASRSWSCAHGTRKCQPSLRTPVDRSACSYVGRSVPVITREAALQVLRRPSLGRSLVHRHFPTTCPSALTSTMVAAPGPTPSR